jgi:ribulose-phosphate 3-epimerase
MNSIKLTQKKFIITPSILSADFTCLGEQIGEAESAGADWIHVDVMDGHFVPNLTMGPFIVETCRRITSLPLDVHLMVKHPEYLIDDFAEAGASVIYVHVETCPNLHRTLQQIHSKGCKAGVVINPGTPTSAVEAVLTNAEVFLTMTVNPGYSGQTFLSQVAPKISMLRKSLDRANPEAMIAVDGGISKETLPLVLTAGAQVFVAATAIFKHPKGIAAGVQELRDCLPG